MEECQDLEINYCPHPEQEKVHKSLARFRSLVCGRRWGKTTLAVNELISYAIFNNKARIFYISPTYRQSKMIAFQMIKDYLPQELIEAVNKAELSFTLKNGSEISLKGADTEDSLKGVGLDFVVLDEFASMRPAVWYEEIRPTLSDTGGRALFIGTPKGRNHFYDIFTKNDDEYESFRFPTIDNPYIPTKEVNQAKKDLSERLYKQEYLAEFLDDESSVFKKVRLCTVGSLAHPVIGRFYIIGIDLARTVDFTVLSVIDTVTRQVVAFERIHDVSWTEQKIRIQELAIKYNNALCILDSTGLGDPIYEDLLNAGVSVDGFKFTNDTKCKLIENLAIATEQRLITWPKELEILTQEMQEFEYQLTKTGKVQYGAPEGKHDDCVIALALAVWGIRNNMREAQVVSDSLNQADPVDKQGLGQLHDERVSRDRVHEFTGY